MDRKRSALFRVGVLLLALLSAVIFHPAQAAAGRPPVIIIPGIGGSEFTTTKAFRLTVDNGHGGTYTNDYYAGETVWVNTTQALAFGADDYFDALKLQRDGVTPVAPALQINQQQLYRSGYDDLVGYLQRQGYILRTDLWIFPYDWRADLVTTSERLDALVNQALARANYPQSNPALWSVRRVNIVAHSMGGLLGRYYISNSVRASQVDQLITLGAPQLGTAGFLKALVYGDTMGPWFLGIGLNPEEIKDVVQNMPSGYQLLPSPTYDIYYDNRSSDRLRPWVENRDIDGDGLARGILSYEQVSQLLLNLGKNGPLITKARDFHTGIDRLQQGGVNGVRWSALVGRGYGTLGQMREYTGLCSSWFSSYPCPKRDEIPVDGDGTVPTYSAAMGDPWSGSALASGARIWSLARQHGDLVKRDYVLGIATGDGPALAWIGERLRTSSTTTLEARSTEALAPVTELQAQNEQLGGLWLAALGPVAVQVRDDAGRVTGRDRGASDTTRVELPETRHERLPGSEFAFLKRDAAYTIVMNAEAEGSVDLKVRVLDKSRNTRTAMYLGVLLRAGGHAQLQLKPGAGHAAAPQGWPELEIDADGDGVIERRLPATAVLDERTSADITAPELIIDTPSANAGVAGPISVLWRAADRDSGLLREEAIVDPDTTRPRMVTNGELVVLAPGPHRLRVMALDQAGNANSQEVGFTVQ
ncbi:MAG TPA: hypothetical protein VFU22_15385 [Roseiflexaceae bacterium]|nr:hypothetical protein [Roseiflexaceae bacterium]